MTDTTKAQILDLARKAINTELLALKRMKETLGDNFADAVEMILSGQGKCIVTGMGKSGLVGRKIAATLASTGTPSFFLHPGEAFSRRSGHDLEGGCRAGALLFGRDRRNPENRAFHPLQRQQADLDDRQSRIRAGQELRRAPRRKRRRGKLHPAPRADDLDHGADRHGRRAGRVADADAGALRASISHACIRAEASDAAC